MSAGAALLFLLTHTARNRIIRLVGRARNPRYALAVIAGIAYLGLLTWNRESQAAVQSPLRPELTQLLVALGVAGLVVWAWVYSHDRRALAFTTAEVAFLFPAPVSRRALVRFKLARSQLLVLLNTVIWAVVIDVGRPGMSVWKRAIAVWCILSTLHLHRLGAAFSRASLVERGWRVGRVVTATLLIGGVALAVAAAIAAAPVLADARSIADLARAIEVAAALPLPALVLVPFRLLVAPLGAAASDWLAAMLPAAAILAVHYLWVVYADSAFEEAAAEASFARSRELEARRSGGRPQSSRATYSPALLPLSPVGSPALAIFWKNVTMVLRRGRARTLTLAFIAALLAAVAAQDFAPRIAQTVGMVVLTWGGLLVALGPQWARNDLRTDLARIDLLRSYPLEPDALVRAEAAGSALMVTLSQLVLIVIGAAALWQAPELRLAPGERAIALLSAVVLLPCLNFMGLMLMNGAALLFPAWVNTAGTRAGGVDMLGQNMLTAVAYILTLSLTLLPPAILGAAIGYALVPAIGPWGMLVAVAAGAMLLVFEAWVLSVWLGMAFERIDPPTAGIEPA